MSGQGKQVMGSSSKKRKGAQQPPHGSDFASRFVNQAAMTRYTTDFFKRLMVIERALSKDARNLSFLTKLHAMGWTVLTNVDNEELNETLVREFFANLRKEDLEQGFVWCRGVEVKLNDKIINAEYDFEEFRGEDYVVAITRLIRDEKKDPLDELRQKIDPTLEWEYNANGTRKNLTATLWPEEWKLKLRFIQNRLLPKKNITHAGVSDLMMLYAIEEKLPVNVGFALWDAIYQNATFKRVIGCPRLIHKLCIKAGVQEYASDIKAKQPKEMDQDHNAPKVPTAHSSAPVRGSSSEQPTQPISNEVLSAQMLSIAYQQRLWFEFAHESREAIQRNLRDINNSIHIEDDSRFIQPAVEFLYDASIEEAIARMRVSREDAEHMEEEN